MSPEAQREALAKAMGWKLRKWTNKKGKPCSGWTTPDGEQCGGIPPNYLDDLEAARDATKHLLKNDEDWSIFIHHLSCLLNDEGKSIGGLNQITAILESQARHITGACLQALGLWEGGEE